MWLSSAIYDPQRYRAEQIYFDYLRAAFNDPLPLHDYAPLHPLMIHNAVEQNRVRQHAILDGIAHYQAEEHQHGEQLRTEWEQARHMAPQNPPVPKPGQPGYRPPRPGDPGFVPPGRPNVPGQPGFDPNRPATPPGPAKPDESVAAPQPSVPPQKFDE